MNMEKNVESVIGSGKGILEALESMARFTAYSHDCPILDFFPVPLGNTRTVSILRTFE